jgi:RNA binding exosome subunit
MEVLSMEGHYGNPLTRITVRFKGRGAREVARYIFSRLEKSDFETIIYTIDRRFDGKGRVFIRLSKQDAYLGKLRLYEREDVIRVMLTLPGVRRSENVERILRQIRGE